MLRDFFWKPGRKLSSPPRRPVEAAERSGREVWDECEGVCEKKREI